MQQILTLKLDSQLEQFLAQLAQQKELSLNETALSVLRQAANLPEKPKTQENTPIGDKINEFVGIWTKEEAAEFRASIAFFDVIDEDLWK